MQVTTAVSMMMAQHQTSTSTSSTATLYKLSPPITTANALTDIPCGKCPVIARCSVGGVISPSTCLYLKEWLAMPETSTSTSNGTNSGSGNGGDGMDTF